MYKYFTVPDTTFKTRVRDTSIGGDNPFRWQDVTSAELFKNRRVVLFSLPGAFTPTCSTYQVPGFDNLATEMYAHGIDDVYVVSVNDAFTMRKWLLDQNTKHLKAIPDGNGEFTRKMGMLVDKSNLGFGWRSWRYAAVINDMKIEQLWEEPGRKDLAEDDPYVVSTPENVLEYLKRGSRV